VPRWRHRDGWSTATTRPCAIWCGTGLTPWSGWTCPVGSWRAELLRVAGFLATFAGLSFTVYLVTDPTYRNEFRTDVASELREAFGVRAACRWALAEESSPITAGPGA